MVSVGDAVRSAFPSRDRNGSNHSNIVTSESTTASPPKLAVKGLSVAFKHGDRTVHALDDISLSIEERQFVAIIGASGSGKSTLLNVMAGLLKPRVGSVEVGGVRVTKPGDSRVAYMFQQEVLLPWKTIADNIALPLRLRGVSVTPALVQEQLAMVGLRGFGDSYPHHLSGGMRQRAQLARTLIQDPEILLMDEPFGAVDAQTRRQLQEEFLRLAEGRRLTVLLVTHDVQEAVLLADRVIVFRSSPGRVQSVVDVPFGRPREVLKVIQHAEFASLTSGLVETLSSTKLSPDQAVSA